MAYSRDGNVGTNSRYIRGDTDPRDFSWDDLLTSSELISLLVRNSKMRKATQWVATEALRERFEFDSTSPVQGTKFGEPFTFETPVEWLEWIGFFKEAVKAITWSRLFGNAIIVFFQDEEDVDNTKRYTGTIAPHFQSIGRDREYTSCQALHPLTHVGYVIKKTEPFTGQPTEYQVTLVDELGQSIQYFVDRERVVEFPATQLECKYGGTSEVRGLAPLALIQEQTHKAMMKRLHLMQGGVMCMSATNEEEVNVLESNTASNLTYLDKIYTSGDPKTAMDIYVPDLKSAQYREMWDITQEEIATSLNISKKLLIGDPEGAISSAVEDKELSYAIIYATQKHYRRAIEHCLWKLGIDDTRFTWNDPIIAHDNTEEDTDNDRDTDRPGTKPTRDSPRDSRSPPAERN